MKTKTTTKKFILTPKQKELLEELISDSEGDQNTWIECLPSEKRTADALDRKGYIKVGKQDDRGFFEILFKNKSKDIINEKFKTKCLK